MMQKILLGLTAVAAVAGWVVAFLSMSESSDLEDQMAAAKIERTKASEQLTDTQGRLALMQGAASSLDDIHKPVAARAIARSSAALTSSRNFTAADITFPPNGAKRESNHRLPASRKHFF